MIKIPYDQILKKIESQSDIDRLEIETKIETKMEQLNGLISKEGAAHIIANELGVKLLEQSAGLMKISSILPGMRNIEFVGKILSLYDVREFLKDNKPGKVGSCIIADETGSIRITCWHDQTKVLTEAKIDDIVRIVGGYVRENNGGKEVHLNDKSRFILNPPNIEITVIKSSSENKRKRINELIEFESNIEVLGTIVQVFEPRFFETCKECRKRATIGENGYICETHGVVTPNYGYVMNCILDDGTDTIRLVLFNQQAIQLSDKTEDEFLDYKNDITKFDDIKNNLLGKQIVVSGRSQKNVMFDRLEFLVRDVNTRPNVDEEINKLELELSVKT